MIDLLFYQKKLPLAGSILYELFEMSAVLKIHNKDNVLVLLQDLKAGASVVHDHSTFIALEDIDQKHKMATEDILRGENIIMYGTIVGTATSDILRGAKITTQNTKHHTAPFKKSQVQQVWHPPDVSFFDQMTFQGYHRKDGKVGTRNFWIFVPLVFCENRNIQLLKDTLVEPLGYTVYHRDRFDISELISAAEEGRVTFSDISIETRTAHQQSKRVFDNIDGIKFLNHEGGCGCTRQDSDILCKLLASYIAHPNVAGATVLSLGCQNAQIGILKEYLQGLRESSSKPVYFFEQQASQSEPQFIEDIIKQTFVGLQEANKLSRAPAPLSKITLGLECGGSDGFSGLTANPALGHCTDMLIALGGTAILSEFPELHGAEQEILDRCQDPSVADRFLTLMQSYHSRARADGSGFESNPSPGNIRDGLITDAIKSLGAARKGGSSPIVEVLDYAEVASSPGLHLLCTPGNDVESTTGLAGAGANVIVFTTGLGTPTGNVICPTLKMATNTALAQRMHDIIDLNAGTIIEGQDTLSSKGRELLIQIIQTASGKYIPKAEHLGQDDFIPWKRGISL